MSALNDITSSVLARNGDEVHPRDTLLARIVKGWSYKPDHHLTLKRTPFGVGMYELIYTACVQDVTDPNHAMIYVSKADVLPPLFHREGDYDAEYVHHIIDDMIERMERHERDEWLKFDGVHLRDPGPAHD